MTRVLALFAFIGMLIIGMATPAAADGHQVQYTADLDGSKQIGAGPGLPPSGTGTAVIDVDMQTNEVCYRITHSDISEPTAAHIHIGGAGSNGGVVVNLDWAANGSSGCVTSDVPTLAAIANAPSLYYVNVHNEDYPSGVIRGQLTKSAGEPAALAFTGTNLTAVLAVIGSALLATGGLLVAASRRET